jgi:replication factor C subunit 2/4
MDELFQVWETKDVDLIRANLESVFLQGYSGLQLLSQIHKEIVDGSRMSKTQKAKLAIQVAKTEKRLFDGADEELQLLQLLCCS